MNASVSLLAIAAAVTFSATLGAAEPGTTRVARWLDDKQAAFVLMFDDSCPSHMKYVIPELEKRHLTATFYVVPGGGVWKQNEHDWQTRVVASGMEYGNHTFTHSGFSDLAGAQKEFADCNAVIHQLTPDLPWPRIVSFAQPGGLKKERWQITKEDLAAIMTTNHLVLRPDFGNRGAMIGVKTPEEMVHLADKALQDGGLEAVIFHGVGGDWITTPLPVFTGFLDQLETRRDRLWITGHARAAVYQAERDAATVTAGTHDDQHLTLTLACTADPQLYNLPLTLVTQVPVAWTACTVTQGKASATVATTGGALRYTALPGSDVIEIRPAH